MFPLTTQELYHLSVIPKADLTVKVHFSIKHLDKIMDRIVGKEDE